MYVSQLDEGQKETFEKFKNAVKDCKLIDPSDDYLLKWLIARNFDLVESEKMLRHSIEWRRANRIDEVVDQWEPPVVLVKYYPMGICGHDKFLCPVWVVNFGRADWRGMLQSVSKRDYLRYITYLAEKSCAEMRKNSMNSKNPVTYQTLIIDMEELNMRQMAFKPFRDAGFEAIKMSEANYPESLRRVFIINAPKIFTFVFGMVKPLLHQMTQDKIRIFGFDKDEWKAALLEDIDADQLPAYYGGTLTDPDGNPKCPSKFSMGGEVPQSYYLELVKPTPKSNMTFVTIPSGSKKKLEFKIIAVNSLLRWEFMTEEGDIGFTAYYLERNGERVDIVTNDRVQSHITMEEGEIICVRPVLYVIEFDNSYSYVRSKKLWYNIVVDMPTSF